MGIRFFCPQGHKLNVKSFLAGKTGFCPHCNAKVAIPLTSTRDSSKTSEKDDAAAGDGPVTVPVTGPGPGQLGTAPVAQPVTAYGQSNVPVAQPATAVPAAAQGVTGGMPASPIAAQTPLPNPGAVMPGQMPVAAPAVAAQPTIAQPSTPQAVPYQPAAPQATNDPIAESPQAVWYVRPTTGGQYGPAAADVMQQWLDQGRVASDSLVWREGWPDWRTASTTFPKFVGQH
jgi:hypothetical protein